MEFESVRAKFSKARKLDPIQLLRAALDEKCRKNPSYSIRAFSRASGISPTVLSLVLSGKRRLSKKATLKLADFLNLSDRERERLIWPGTTEAPSHQQLDLEAFSVISDWYHYAILSALELPGSQFEERWLSKQLGITVLEAKLAVDRLVQLGLVAQDSDGVWRQTGLPIKIENSRSTAATRKFHKQLLIKASESIDQDPISVRDISSMTFAMDASLIEHARKRIQTFRRELTAELEQKGSPGAVYQLNVQLFPLSTRTKET